MLLPRFPGSLRRCCLLLGLAGSLAAAVPALARHAPHDGAYSVAVAALPGGGEEVVVVSDYSSVLASRDGLLTFHLLTGGGLEGARPTCVTHNPSLPWQKGVADWKGIFFIGTETGVWAYQPSDADRGGPVVPFSDGLPSSGSGRLVKAMASPDGQGRGPQPTFLLAGDGRLYCLREGALLGWEEVLDTGAPVVSGAVLCAPGFAWKAAGPEGTVFAAANSRLFRSQVGGGPGTWAQVADFGGWSVLALALDLDYGRDPAAELYVGLGRRAAGPPGDEGEIRTSNDHGATFARRYRLGTSVASLVAAPRGPTQGPAVFAAGREYPGANGYVGTGILRSGDRGRTWSDGGTWQCFLLENEPGTYTGYAPLRFAQQLAVPPGYETSGRLLYARNEGLFASGDEGRLWWERPLRTSEEARDVCVAVDRLGDPRMFAATYGAGTAGVNLRTGEVVLAPKGMEFVYQLPIVASPDFGADGAVFAGGVDGINAWFDPVVSPPQNPYGRSGAVPLPLRHATTGKRVSVSVRTLALSPGFSAAPGSPDQVFYFGSYTGALFVSMDSGQTCQEAEATSGGTLPGAWDLAIAPGFRAAPPHSDVFLSGMDGTLWRMTSGIWNPVAPLGGAGESLLVDPGFEPMANRRLWVGLDSGQVLEVLDNPTPVLRPVGSGLPRAQITGLTTGTSGTTRWLYAVSWSRGVWRVALGGAEVWEPLPLAGFPSAFVHGGVALAPAWPLDGRVFVGTGRGAYVLDEQNPAAGWQPVLSSLVWDNQEASVLRFDPGDPLVPDPALPWPWPTVGASAVPGGTFGPHVAKALHDGAYVLARGHGRKVLLHTFSGPRMGELTLSAWRLGDGAFLGSVTEDLSLPLRGEHEVVLDLALPAPEALELRAEASLDAGEIVLYDALEFQR